ncbi:MAG: glycosyltransferase [Sphingomonadaceae bacterium]|nr:glycosyltransferase [Sphingomonadaceae bacterium]
MKCSVVIRSLNEADRLALTLTSLACQTVMAEAVVVNDGSSDHTARVVEEFRERLPLTAITHTAPKGRSAASNAGAAQATGDVLIFLDGDTLAHREFVERHLAAHAARPGLLGRGDTYNLRCTRFFLNPETATPRPEEAERVNAMSDRERERLKVTRLQIEEDFASIEKRATAGVYPGAGPRKLYELEIMALKEHPDCTVLWAAASGANFSVPRDLFLASGGFDERIEQNEHRECALRLCNAGGRMGFVEGAKSYHLTHRIGWRDPLTDASWERLFYSRYPILAVKLLSIFWASIADKTPVPPEAQITSLADLERRARGKDGIDYDAARRAIPGLADLTA